MPNVTQLTATIPGIGYVVLVIPIYARPSRGHTGVAVKNSFEVAVGAVFMIAVAMSGAPTTGPPAKPPLRFWCDLTAW